jgi:hypothetical protein
LESPPFSKTIMALPQFKRRVMVKICKEPTSLRGYSGLGLFRTGAEQRAARARRGRRDAAIT